MSATAELCSELLSSGSTSCHAFSRNHQYPTAAPGASFLYLNLLDAPSAVLDSAQSSTVAPGMKPGPIRVGVVHRDVRPTLGEMPTAGTGKRFLGWRRWWHGCLRYAPLRRRAI